MKRQTKEAFTLSIAVHLLAIAVGSLLVLVTHLKADEEPPVVFELVTTSDAPVPQQPVRRPAPQATPPEPVAERPPELELPRFDDLRPVPELPEPPAPKPQVQPEPRPAPRPEPAPPPQRVSFEEWSRNRNLPPRTQQAPPPRTRSVDVPTIRTDIRQSLSSTVGAVEPVDLSALSSAQQDALQRYFAALVARLQAVFEPTGAGLTARVEFTVQRDGTISNVRILRSSGDAGFDNSVREAFRRVRSAGAPPGNPPHVRTITFTSDD